ncbi:MAG: F0F1 ATP synthase subunit B' [Alphaproteobacteria bacterium]|nr:MAG: F0F1 ATP synthase subunit B' [Alphaproteobacteria bacterium]
MTEQVSEVPSSEEGPNFPPFDVTTFQPQVVWLAISFVLFYVILSRLVLPRIQRVMAEREERIAADLDEAERLHKELEELKEAIAERLAEARTRAQGILARARDEMREKSERELAALEERLGQRIRDAEDEIARAKDEILGRIDEIAHEAVHGVFARLGFSEPGEDEIREALEKARRQTQEAA